MINSRIKIKMRIYNKMHNRAKIFINNKINSIRMKMIFKKNNNIMNINIKA
jgi:hypothetical protein